MSSPTVAARRTLGKRARDWLLALVSLVVALGLAELVTRALHAAPRLERMRSGIVKSAYRASDNPILGYELKASYRDLEDPDLHESFPFTNALGLRDVERTVEKPPGVRRIVVLGDSVVAGHGIFDVDDIISRQLEKRLPPADKIEVLGVGVGGYNTRSEAELLRIKGLSLSPDLVIVVWVENDYSAWNYQVDHYVPPPPPAAEWAFVHSHLFRLASLALNLFHFREAYDPEFQRAKNTAAIGEDNVARGVREIAAMLRGRGVPGFLVLWPKFGDGIEEPDPQVVDSRMRIERIADENQLAVFRLSDAFRRDFAARPPAGPTTPRALYTIGDGMHPSPEGTAVAADALLKLLAENPRYLAPRR